VQVAAAPERMPWSLAAAIVAIVAAGAALECVRYFGGDDTVLAAVAFGAPYWTVAAVALVAERTGRPWRMFAAGLALAPMSMISWAFVLVPLLIPAGILIARGAATDRRCRPREALVCLAIGAGIVASLFLLIGQDVVTTARALLTLAMCVAVVAVAVAAPA
jgi:hypothetical protein